MQGQRLRYFGAIFVMLVATILSYGPPLVSRATIDYILQGKPLQAPAPIVRAIEYMGGREVLARNLWLASISIVSLMAMAGLLNYLRMRWANVAAEAAARRMRAKLYDHLQHLPCSYHDKAETGDLVQRCTSDVETVRSFLSMQIVEIGRAVIMTVAVLPIMFWLSPRMTLVAMCVVPIIAVFSFVFFAKVKFAFKLSDEAEGAMTTVLQENLTGIRVVRAFARQDFECEKFAVKNAAYRDRTFNLIYLMAWYWSSSDYLCLLQRCLVIAVGALWVLNGKITVGTMFAFIAYIDMLLWPVRQMGRILTELGKAMVSLQRIQEILQQKPETDIIAEPAGNSGRPSFGTDGNGHSTPARSAIVTQAENASAGHIVFRDVVYGYEPDKPVISGISFEVQPGQTLAVLGPSGSGKSTLMHLLMRMYDSTQGSITVDGDEIRGLPRKALRSRIGVVLQEPFLYSKSLRENIRMSRPGAVDDDITHAAQMACIHESIEQFDQKYDTLVGERGVTLSGGQRQRVALARAILRDPPILLLDDALSAVDTHTESMILGALRGRKGRHTTLVIAHRLSTLMQADRIIVLEHGKIVQSGTHAGLVEEDGLYGRLWKIQSSLEEDLDSELLDPAGQPPVASG